MIIVHFFFSIRSKILSMGVKTFWDRKVQINELKRYLCEMQRKYEMLNHLEQLRTHQNREVKVAFYNILFQYLLLGQTLSNNLLLNSLSSSTTFIFCSKPSYRKRAPSFIEQMRNELNVTTLGSKCVLNNICSETCIHFPTIVL